MRRHPDESNRIVSGPLGLLPSGQTVFELDLYECLPPPAFGVERLAQLAQLGRTVRSGRQSTMHHGDLWPVQT